MTRHPPKTLQHILPAVLKQVEQQRGALVSVQREWARLVGRQMAAHAKPVSLRRGRLVIQVDRPGDGFTLRYQQAELLAALQRATQGRVEEIVIRPGA